MFFINNFFFVFFPSYIVVSILEMAAMFLLGKKWPRQILPIKSMHSFKLGFFSGFITSSLKTSVVFILLYLWNMQSPYLPAYLFFFCALFITIFTDFEELVISRYVTLYLAPVGWALSMFKMLPISPIESILGSIFGLILLYVVRAISRKFLHKDGLGQGDIDLLALIGAFIGPFGCWISIMAGSLLACAIALPYALITKQRDFMIPFGMFLSFGAIIFVLFHTQILAFFISL